MPAKPPVFVVSITRRDGAPLRPGQTALRDLFARAWSLVPKARRPDTQGLERLAVDVILVGDEEIADLNAAHMRHTGATDVLSFPMGEHDPERRAFFLGEIVTSFETARREAEARELPYVEELSRYCVHGFLHLVGYDDATPSQQRAMFALQEKALNAGK